MLNLKNVGFAVGISVMSSVLPCLKAKVHAFEFFGRHLGFFHFRLSHTVSVFIPMERWTQNLGKIYTLENIGIAVGILLISRLGAEIHAFEVKRPPSWIFPLRFFRTVFA